MAPGGEAAKVAAGLRDQFLMVFWIRDERPGDFTPPLPLLVGGRAMLRRLGPATIWVTGSPRVARMSRTRRLERLGLRGRPSTGRHRR
jgi:hypothetical protein